MIKNDNKYGMIFSTYILCVLYEKRQKKIKTYSV
jgi:hypothetical protein